MKKLFALVLVLVMVLSCSAMAEQAAATPEGRRVVTFWHSLKSSNLTALEGVVERFNNSQNEIWVEASYQGEYDECLTKLKSAFGANTAPDVFMMFELGANYLANSGYVVPFQDCYDADPFMDLDDLVDVLKNYYTINGKLQCYPFNPSSLVMYYNADLFEEAGVAVPTTLAEIAEVAPVLQATGKVKYAIGLGIYGWNFENFLAGYGGYYLNNENGRNGLATALEYTESGKGAEIMQTWKQLCLDGYAYNYGTKNSDSRVAFCSGDTALCLYSTASLRSITSAATFKVGTAYLPTVEKDAQTAVLVGGANLWMYNSGNAQRQADAWEFVKYYASHPEETATFSEATGYFAVRKSAYDLPEYAAYLTENPSAKVAVQQLLDSPVSLISAGANTGCMTELRQIWQDTMNKYMQDDLTLEQAIDEMRLLSNDAIEFYNEVNGLD